MDTGRSARPFGTNVPSRTTSTPMSGWKDVAALELGPRMTYGRRYSTDS
jgi:hypothetical protein